MPLSLASSLQAMAAQMQIAAVLQRRQTAPSPVEERQLRSFPRAVRILHHFIAKRCLPFKSFLLPGASKPEPDISALTEVSLPATYNSGMQDHVLTKPAGKGQG